MADKLNCICCGKGMLNIMEDRGHQPDDGLSFHTYGHYGSTFFDPMDGSAIQIAVCDECLVQADGKGWIKRPKGKNPDYSWEAMKPVGNEFRAVGWEFSMEKNEGHLKTSWDNHYMYQAFIDFLRFAISNDDIMARFREETGNTWTPSKNVLERMIDKETGAEFAFIQQFSDWCEKVHFGTPDDMDKEMPL